MCVFTYIIATSWFPFFSSGIPSNIVFLLMHRLSQIYLVRFPLSWIFYPFAAPPPPPGVSVHSPECCGTVSVFKGCKLIPDISWTPQELPVWGSWQFQYEIVVHAFRSCHVFCRAGFPVVWDKQWERGNEDGSAQWDSKVWEAGPRPAAAHIPLVLTV